MVARKVLTACCLLIGGIFSIPSMADNINKLPKDYYVFSAVANVRAGSAETFLVIDQLVNGDTVTVLERGSPLTVGNITGDWLKISYVKQGEKEEGYLWEGNLSPVQLKKGDLRFVFGLDRYDEKQQRYIGSVKVIKAKGIAEQYWFYVDAARAQKMSGQFVKYSALYDDQHCFKLIFSDKSGNSLNQYYFKYDDWGKKSQPNLVFLMKTTTLKTATSHHIETLAFTTVQGQWTAIKLYKTITIEDSKKPINYKYLTEMYGWHETKLILYKRPYGGEQEVQ